MAEERRQEGREGKRERDRDRDLLQAVHVLATESVAQVWGTGILADTSPCCWNQMHAY